MFFKTECVSQPLILKQYENFAIMIFFLNSSHHGTGVFSQHTEDGHGYKPHVVQSIQHYLQR